MCIRANVLLFLERRNLLARAYPEPWKQWLQFFTLAVAHIINKMSLKDF